MGQRVTKQLETWGYLRIAISYFRPNEQFRTRNKPPFPHKSSLPEYNQPVRQASDTPRDEEISESVEILGRGGCRCAQTLQHFPLTCNWLRFSPSTSLEHKWQGANAAGSGSIPFPFSLAFPFNMHHVLNSIQINTYVYEFDGIVSTKESAWVRSDFCVISMSRISSNFSTTTATTFPSH